MIAYISGKIIELDTTRVVVLTSGGVGYEVFINEISFASLAAEQDVELFVYHHITEGNQSLFGFLLGEEKSIFTELIKISGIGGKVALSILSLGINRLIIAVQGKDSKTIEGIKGIGKKMSEKILLELKDKDFVKNYVREDGGNKDLIKRQTVLSNDVLEDTRTTLVNMGYSLRAVDRAIEKIPEGIDSLEKIIPYVIQNINS